MSTMMCLAVLYAARLHASSPVLRMSEAGLVSLVLYVNCRATCKTGDFFVCGVWASFRAMG